jgi:hypothetical protein
MSATVWAVFLTCEALFHLIYNLFVLSLVPLCALPGSAADRAHTLLLHLVGLLGQSLSASAVTEQYRNCEH